MLKKKRRLVARAVHTGLPLSLCLLAGPVAASWQLAQEGMVQFRGLATNGSLYVAVGNEILTSPDGITWTERVDQPCGVPEALFGVTHGGGQFVAVGNVACVLTSPDGLAWTPRYPGVWPTRLRAVAYGFAGGSPLYVAVGRFGQLLTSPDAITWTDQSDTGASYDFNAVAYGWAANQWVLVGNQGTVLTAWGTPVLPPGMPQDLRGVTYTGSQFVAVGQSPPGVMTSPDGVVWTLRAVPTTQPLRSVTVGNGLIVAVGSGGAILTSSNGVDWTARTQVDPGPGVSISMLALAFGDDGFVAGGARGNVYASVDGTSPWTSQTLPTSRYFQGAAHDGVRFCAVGANGAVASSPDGAVWTSDPALDHRAYWYWNGVAHALGQFWAVGISDTIMSSPDCSAWTARFPATPPAPYTAASQLFDIAYGENLLVAVGEAYPAPGQTVAEILTSPDGFSWTPGDLGLGPTGEAGYWDVTVAYGAGRFVVSMTDQTSGVPALLTSEDGTAWVPQTSPLAAGEFWWDMEYANGLFVAVGSDIWTSPDGISWTRRFDHDDINAFTGVAYRNGAFVAVGEWGLVVSSPDGIHWAQETAVTSHSFFAVAGAVGGTRFAAVGASTIAYADAIDLIFADGFQSSTLGLVGRSRLDTETFLGAVHTGMSRSR